MSNFEATLSNAASRTILSTKSKRCYDIVAGVDELYSGNASATTRDIGHGYTATANSQ